MFPRFFKPLRGPRQGFTLTELALAIVIAGIVMGGVWAAVSAVRMNANIEKTAENMAMTIQNLRAFYKGQTVFNKAPDTEITDKLRDAHVIPASMISPATNLPITPWDTKIRFYVGGTTDTFRISFEAKLPEEACRNLVGFVAGKSRPSGLVNVTAGGTTYSDTNDLDNLSPSSITGNCTSASFTIKLNG